MVLNGLGERAGGEADVRDGQSDGRTDGGRAGAKETRAHGQGYTNNWQRRLHMFTCFAFLFCHLGRKEM